MCVCVRERERERLTKRAITMPKAQHSTVTSLLISSLLNSGAALSFNCVSLSLALLNLASNS